ncbi:MAG: 3-keto-disaccharide hydrolase [Tannerellaceae bacterium]
MKKVNLACLLAAAVLGTSSCTQAHNTLTEAEKQEGWKLLFDGESLQGWRDYNGTEVKGPWAVEEGCLTALGNGSDGAGYIVTNDKYENFIIDWDWKIVDGGNSGLMYHVVERPMYSVPYVTGPEYQMLDDIGFKGELEDWQKVGADYAMHTTNENISKAMKGANQWNNSRIVFDNGHVEHWLNGYKIVEFEAWTDDWHQRKNSGKWNNAPEFGLAKTGRISLQDHGDRTWIRNMKIKELPRKEKQSIALFNGKDLSNWEAYGTEKWYVEDGNLICESGPDRQYGYLATRDYYRDYDLTLEFKQVANGNSGVFIRSFVPEGVKVNGWQVEVAPKGNDTGGIYESYGRGWLVQIPDEKEEILKEGDWNTMRIRVLGDKVTTWLNGEEMVDIQDPQIGNGQGRVALQIHDGEPIKVLWRNIQLQEL